MVNIQFGVAYLDADVQFDGDVLGLDLEGLWRVDWHNLMLSDVVG